MTTSLFPDGQGSCARCSASLMRVRVMLVQRIGFMTHVSVSRWDVSVITPAVVEAVCSSLLAQAEEAEMEAQSLVWAEHMILDEFGHCLTQIVKAMSKYNTY
ncbi:spexin prohormone 2 isoform X2 [Scomber scombrus]|uniref:Spexin prohormone 2 isoform X2 n=1 Tax=Scomber scombrus TaxID=13677 RepID=A0AAV1P440_SCOSC